MSRRGGRAYWTAGVAGALVLAACSPGAAEGPAKTAAQSGPIRVSAEPAPLDPTDPTRIQLGAFTYAGGLALKSIDTARLHGLSDLVVGADGLMLAVTDEGDFVEAALALDEAGRLVGVDDVRVSALAGLDGQPLPNKIAADAEGLAVLPGGDRLVSFEQRHRIWLYPAAGGPPRPVPSPQVRFPANGGMEALSADPAAGPDAYLVGGEDSGQTWSCRLSASCVPGPALDKDAAFGLVGLRRLPEGRTAYLLRAWDPARGNRVRLLIHGPTGEEEDRLELSRPLTVDNFEGFDAVPIDGGLRFYLVSDDNFQASQQTLLMAFDWRPKGAP